MIVSSFICSGKFDENVTVNVAEGMSEWGEQHVLIDCGWRRETRMFYVPRLKAGALHSLLILVEHAFK